MPALTAAELTEKIAEDPDTFLIWDGASNWGSCSHCRRTVDNHDDSHRVTSIMAGGRGVECVARGDIQPHEAAPLGRRER